MTKAGNQCVFVCVCDCVCDMIMLVLGTCWTTFVFMCMLKSEYLQLCHMSHFACHMSYVKCLCLFWEHAEQLLFSCVSSKLSICNYVTCHISHVTCQMPMQTGDTRYNKDVNSTKRWSFCQHCMLKRPSFVHTLLWKRPSFVHTLLDKRRSFSQHCWLNDGRFPNIVV